ncbi:cytotoxic translational repressor of toxin-antitoxin stability system [Oerskovia turbata]|uniref:Cytotoxic translational repressor of toxin-antitoxin stability system n=1 Tax=Oerskovia turbata TaxID=1713 RepID=A0A4Q1KI24_9CELL|nr:hypothetical protein [Oerskovia turbata]RXR21560.1 cytotoxic translational repressor of toxin-antitoxin stability system [Oerskovia turbata]RXR29438.1 cytotoxic translational repressor of toxin-antitoxin stability system [Oerskovia turbata]TGJ96950.1 cytotoxic translational repressor of toxin-antitoxin stability system [Actinotalea fermentans ATCC 43279 = JCM 9966 = DSM 3133]
MSHVKPVTRAAHQSFCDTEGWSLVQDARGRDVSHHVTYELGHPDGRTLRTRISRPVRPVPYGPDLASFILRAQLEVTPGEFWACADDGVIPVRVAVVPEVDTVPLGLLRVLRDEMHLSEDELMALSKEEAIRLVNEHWSNPR